MAHIFVYGTLKKGQPNYYRMFERTNGEAEFVATAQTVQQYPLVIATKNNIPFLLNIPGQGRRIRGEIYKVDEQMLRFLDDFEGVHHTYQRTPIQLEVTESAGNKEKSAESLPEVFVYSTTTYQPEWKQFPTYDDYDTNGSHGLPYVYREARD